MTRLWMVRHGPTHLDGLIGWTDAPADLSDTAAINRLSAYLPQNAFVISSSLIRCVATADAIQNNRVRLPHDPDLRELNFGDWENRTFADVSKTDPVLSEAYWSEPGSHAPPQGESWDIAQTRINCGVDRLIKNHRNKDIIIVAHFGVILTQLQRATKMPAKSVLAFKIDNLSVTYLEHMGSAWRVLGVNHSI